MKIFLNKHATLVLVGAILFLSFVMYIASQLSAGDSDEVIVLVDGREYGTYSLHESREIRIETEQGYNILTIEDGSAYVREADCDNQVCVHTQPVRGSGGQIICLPHRVVIRLTTTEKSEIDAVTN